MALYFAQNSIDTWGIDLRWGLLQEDFQDFDKIKEWGVQEDLNDIEIGLILSRMIRSLTQSGFGRLNVLGHSTGAFLTYAAINQESQLPSLSRSIKGIIPIEILLHFSPEETERIQASQLRYQGLKEDYDTGEYVNQDGVTIRQLSLLAQLSPDDPSPVLPGITNEEAGLIMNSCGYSLIEPPFEPFVPFYHFLAATFDPDTQIPYEFQFVDKTSIWEIYQFVPPYLPLAGLIEVQAMWSELVDVPFDDYLDQVKVPVLYIGAAGGIGEYGVYSTTLLDSPDQTQIIVRLYPVGSEALDFGHLDILWGTQAPSLVWQPITDWISTH
jgi:hypothetical protein